MARLILVHWHAAEAAERAARLGAAGHDVTIFCEPKSGATLRTWRDDPPDAFVIDLARLPSHGRDVGTALRRQKGTREVPLLFVPGADAAKNDGVRALLPDATYVGWRGLPAALRRALAARAKGAPKTTPVKAPVVPDAMAGYSGTPLPKKLGIKPGGRVRLVGAPEEFEALLEPLPPGVRLARTGAAAAEVVLFFVTSHATLGRGFAGAAKLVAEGGRLWTLWPKKASGVPCDTGEGAVRAFGLASGWVDYKIAAIDATWSGLCFARRGLRAR